MSTAQAAGALSAERSRHESSEIEPCRRSSGEEQSCLTSAEQSCDISPAAQQLQSILESRVKVAAILSEPRHTFDTTELESLEEICDHLLGARKRAKPNRKGTQGGARHAWQPILNLEHLTLPAAIERQLTQHGPDAAKFLTDQHDLENILQDYDRNNDADALFSCVTATANLEARQEKDHVKICILMWTFFGIIQLVRPRSTGRVGRSMLEEVKTLLIPALDEVSVREESCLTGDISSSIHEWSLLGAKLDHLCGQFGPGVIFWLGNVLSRNFLRKEFTGKGKGWEQAVSHLESIGFYELRRQRPEIDELAIGARKFLLRPFERKKKSQMCASDRGVGREGRDAEGSVE